MNVGRRMNLISLLDRDISLLSPSDICVSGSWASELDMDLHQLAALGLRFPLLKLNSTTGFPGSQLVDERSWDLQNQSQESIPVTNLLLSISLYIIFELSFGEPDLI